MPYKTKCISLYSIVKFIQEWTQVIILPPRFSSLPRSGVKAAAEEGERNITAQRAGSACPTQQPPRVRGSRSPRACRRPDHRPPLALPSFTRQPPARTGRASPSVLLSTWTREVGQLAAGPELRSLAGS